MRTPQPRTVGILIGMIAALLLAAGTTSAGGFQSPEQGQPNIGTAEAGQAALANDASTTYYNPAGMTRLKRNEILFGGHVLDASMRFHHGAGTTFTGNDGGQAGGFFPGGGFYFVHPCNERLSAGMSVNVPAGIGVNYDDNWKGRYFVQEDFMAIVDFNPVIAYRVNNWFSIGGGVDVYYGFLKENMALYNPLETDGRIKMKYDDWSVGGNLGVLFEPSRRTRIGVTYRSEADFELTGDINFENIGKAWSLIGLKDAYGKVNIVLPMNVMASIYHDINDRFAVMADAGWQDWSSMKKTTVTTASGTALSIDRDWQDTWHTGLGVHYRATKSLLLKAGISYDSSPTEADHRLPDLPVDRQWRYALGCDYDVNKDVTVSVSGMFIDTGAAAIDKNLLGGLLRLEGDYDQYIAVLGFSVRWRFGR